MNTDNAAWLYSGIQPSRMICVAATTVLVYDYLSTLDKEVDLIWKRRLGGMGTILFVINRYLPYVYVVSTVKEYWFLSPSQEACLQWDIANIIIVTIGITLSEIILALRTWALWQRSRIILGIFGIAAGFKAPLILLSIYHVLKNVHYVNVSPSEIVCISPVIGSWSWETLIFCVVLVVETLIALLTLIKAVEAQHSRSRWFFKMHYMGIIYYFGNLMMVIFNLIGTVKFHNVGSLTFGLLQGVLQSLLCSRVIFLAREPSELAINGISQLSYPMIDHYASQHELIKVRI